MEKTEYAVRATTTKKVFPKTFNTKEEAEKTSRNMQTLTIGKLLKEMLYMGIGNKKPKQINHTI